MPSNADKVTSSSLSASSPVALLLINQSRTFPSSVISPENAKKFIDFWICVADSNPLVQFSNEFSTVIKVQIMSYQQGVNDEFNVEF